MTKYVVIFLIAACNVFGSFESYLKEPNKIPLYAQQTNVWCGAASAQMMLEGFPNDVNKVYKQKYIWDAIQEVKVETSWYTDPDGLKNVMNDLGDGSTWQARCVKGSSAPLLKTVLQSLANQKYPVTALVYGSDHWIVVIGATTDLNPNEATSVKLEQIEAFDPWKAQHVLVSGSTWFQKYWSRPARTRGKWSGCYVGIMTTSVDAERDLEITVKPQPDQTIQITSLDAIQSAKHHLIRLASQNSRYAILSKETLLESRLVKHESGSYYLIPIGNPQTRLSKGAVMINAHNGDWEGLSLFKEKFRYLDVAPGGEWIFSPSEESRSPFHPVYRIGTSFIDQEGKVSSSLHKMRPGSQFTCN